MHLFLPGRRASRATPPRPKRRPGRRIGLLGGSFNPAHDGHRHISLEALKRLALDEVWWLVSPQNPLKDAGDMAPLATRMDVARRVARHPRIRVTDIEAQLGTRYTLDTIEALKRRHPTARFVWLMGADNLAQISRWRGWTGIFHSVPVAVFTRPTYSLRALSGKAARRFARFRIPERMAPQLPGREPPAWVFLRGRLHPESATRIRAARSRAKPGRKQKE